MLLNQNTNEMIFDMVHLFCGSGGGALGFQMSGSEYKGMKGRFHTVVGFDNDPLCCQDFEKLTGAPAVCLDLFSREQYTDFHGHEPAVDWHEVTPQEIRDIVLKLNDGRVPDGFFLSPPCKGFSGLLPEQTSKSAKYQALNGLVVRAMWLIMEAFKDDPVAFIMIENVPRITSRGATLLSQIKGYLKQFKYVFHEGTHDCGEIGGLGQIRKRFLLMARNPQKIPSFIYQPPKLKLKSIGDILGPLPMPGDVEKAGKMHRIPNLHWKTWERLALIPAGQDWRALNNIDHSSRNGGWKIMPWDKESGTITGRMRVGQSNVAASLADPRLENVKGYGNKYRVVKQDEPCVTVTGSRLGSGAPIYADPKIPKFAANANKVMAWEDPAGTITGGAGISNGGGIVQDPRIEKEYFHNSYKVTEWDEPAGTVTSGMSPSSGAKTVADPRIGDHPTWRRTSVGKVIDWNEPSGAIMGSVNLCGAGSGAVSDPRLPHRDKRYPGLYKVVKWDESSPVVIGQTDIQAGALSVQDPRMNCSPRSGTMGVQDWDEPGKTVIASGDIHAAAAAVADPRIPEPDEKGIYIIIAEDGTWHRPITTFEMAMLQSLPANFPDGSPLVLAGNSDAIWREHIGNMVPPNAACAMGNSLLDTLMPNYLGDWHWGTADLKIWVINKINEIRGYFQ
jgi:site-specific DNA-cytosine methylase